MKKWKKKLCLLLGFWMIVMQVACGTSRETDVDSAEDQNQTQEDQNQDDSQVNPGQDESPQEGGQILHLTKMTVSDYCYDEDLNEMLASLEYPEVLLSETDEAAYPKLADALQKLNQSKKEQINQNYEEILITARDDADSNLEYFETHTSEEQVYVRRADSAVLSLLYQGYYYNGGAHGFTYHSAKNIDSATGEILELTDVVTDVEALPALLEAELFKQYDSGQFYDDINMETYIEEQLDRLVWVLEYQGLSVYFDQYELGSYAGGAFHVMIPFAEHPELFTEAYTVVPEAYGVELIMNDPYYYDPDQDGVTDRVEVSGVWDEEGFAIIQHRISLNTNVSTSDSWSYDMSGKLLHTQDGQTYLYVEDGSDNDYRTVTVYRLSKGYTERIGDLNGGFCAEYVEMDGTKYGESAIVLTDPSDFKMEFRTELLSTVGGTRSFYVGEDGMPKSDALWYEFQTPIMLTLKQDLAADIIDYETGEKIGETTLTAGGQLEYFAADDLGHALFRMDDGGIAQVLVDCSEWPAKVNEIDIDEIFDGMIYAG